MMNRQQSEVAKAIIIHLGSDVIITPRNRGGVALPSSLGVVAGQLVAIRDHDCRPEVVLLRKNGTEARVWLDDVSAVSW
jgi:hypothetical protein